MIDKKKRKNIRIFHECGADRKIHPLGLLFGITPQSLVMPNSDPKGSVFLSALNNLAILLLAYLAIYSV